MNYFAIPGIQKTVGVSDTIDEKKLAEKIITICANVWGTTDHQIKSRWRRRNLVEARHSAMYLIFENTKLPKNAIGRFFRRDHSTVIHGIKQAKALIETDRTYESKFLQAEARTLRHVE